MSAMEPSLEEKYLALVEEYQDIVKALEGIDGLGGDQLTSGPVSPADLVRGLVAMLGEQEAEINRLRERYEPTPSTLPIPPAMKRFKP